MQESQLISKHTRHRQAGYAKSDRKLNAMRKGLKELITDTITIRLLPRRRAIPDCPMVMYRAKGYTYA
jgi:hypothetical protein